MSGRLRLSLGIKSKLERVLLVSVAIAHNGELTLDKSLAKI